MGYCVSVTNDTEDNIAYDVLKIRLNDKLWPIYIRTPFKKKLVVNYKVLFYVAGKNKLKQNIVASSIISDINYDFDDKKIFCELKLEEINFNYLHQIILNNNINEISTNTPSLFCEIEKDYINSPV